MKKFTNRHLNDIEKQIKKIEQENTSQIINSAHILSFLESKLEELKEFIIKYEFETETEEILFFKEIKPEILSKFIYHLSVYEIEVNRPKGGMPTVETYLLDELDRIKHFFDRNIEIYHYYRTGCTHLDKIYFLRNSDANIPINVASFYFERDVRFSTGYDYKISRIIAYDCLELYIESQLRKLKDGLKPEDRAHLLLKTRETWTASKTDLIELIYALDTAKCINYGNIKLNALTTYMENVFNIDIGDIYRTYLEIRERKKKTARNLSIA